MSFFISDAMADAATTSAQSAGGMSSLLMMAAIFVLFYFVLIRPQSKRAKEHKELIGNLKKGDEVITSGGILAKVINVEDSWLRISPAEGVEMLLQKNAIISVLPKGTLKSL